jgi:hypothetical protein
MLMLMLMLTSYQPRTTHLKMNPYSPGTLSQVGSQDPRAVKMLDTVSVPHRRFPRLTTGATRLPPVCNALLRKGEEGSKYAPASPHPSA